MNPKIRGIVCLLFITFLVVGRLQSASDDQDKRSFNQSSLRSILIKQPDFSAELEYEKETGVRMMDQVKTIMKRGDMYRFEVPEENSLDGAFFLLAFPDKGIRIISPKEKVWTDQVDLDQAAFTTLSGVDIYYLTKIIDIKIRRLNT
jgi:hypothetical protein